jgi:hypothetical protein
LNLVAIPFRFLRLKSLHRLSPPSRVFRRQSSDRGLHLHPSRSYTINGWYVIER